MCLTDVIISLTCLTCCQIFFWEGAPQRVGMFNHHRWFFFIPWNLLMFKEDTGPGLIVYLFVMNQWWSMEGLYIPHGRTVESSLKFHGRIVPRPVVLWGIIGCFCNALQFCQLSANWDQRPTKSCHDPSTDWGSGERHRCQGRFDCHATSLQCRRAALRGSVWVFMVIDIRNGGSGGSHEDDDDE